ncbi:hypothetical protein RJT34_31074 [Clitoria ternatea]|uniref:Uncharacterized protein n=1 Tax=Clitoria ternatea TaxID=43366 RepID=A0AAN9I114_CLITE
MGLTSMEVIATIPQYSPIPIRHRFLCSPFPPAHVSRHLSSPSAGTCFFLRPLSCKRKSILKIINNNPIKERKRTCKSSSLNSKLQQNSDCLTRCLMNPRLKVKGLR